MNTKTFARISRTKIMQGVESKLRYWGFTKNGIETDAPIKIEGGYMFRGEVFDDDNTLILWAIAKNGYWTERVRRSRRRSSLHLV